MESENRQFSPLLPYDVTFGETLDMYDKMKYIRNVDVCNSAAIAMETGNVCKFFRCKSSNPIKLGGDRK